MSRLDCPLETNSSNQHSVTDISFSLTHTLFISVLRHAASHTDVSPESSFGKQGASFELFLKPSQHEAIAETRMKEIRTVLTDAVMGFN